MNSDDIRLMLTIAVPSLTVIAGILISGRQFSELRSAMDARFDGLHIRFDHLSRSLDERLQRTERLIDTGIRRLEERYDR